LVLNQRAGNDVISVIKLNSPYNLLVDLDKVPLGRLTTTAVEPVLDTLYQLLINYPRLRSRLDKTKLILLNLVKPDAMATLQFLV